MTSDGETDEIKAFAEQAKQYRADQAEMIAKRDAKDKAIADWRESEMRFAASGVAFRRASEKLGDALTAYKPEQDHANG